MQIFHKMVIWAIKIRVTIQLIYLLEFSNASNAIDVGCQCWFLDLPFSVCFTDSSIFTKMDIFYIKWLQRMLGLSLKIRQKILIILVQEIVCLNKYTKTLVQPNQSFHLQGKFHQLQKEFAKLVSNYVMMIPAMVTAELRKMKVHTCWYFSSGLNSKRLP